MKKHIKGKIRLDTEKMKLILRLPHFHVIVVGSAGVAGFLNFCIFHSNKKHMGDSVWLLLYYLAFAYTLQFLFSYLFIKKESLKKTDKKEDDFLDFLEGCIYTKDGFLVKATEEEYEAGNIVLISMSEEKEFGSLDVKTYRNLKKKPFFEPWSYIGQLFNLCWVAFCLVTRISWTMPIVYFWFIAFGIQQKAIDIETMTLKDICDPALFNILLMFVVLITIGSMFFTKIPGYKNVFTMRFKKLLDKKFPLLSGINEYKLKWVAKTEATT